MRIIDLMASLFGLVVLGPVLATVALAVKLSSPGPVLYRARRVGRGGKLFTMYKFRTMRVGADAGARITAGDLDDRITPVGRRLRASKLDELPQLLNVLAGQMALVGPRPEDPSFLPHYTQDEWGVLAVRPGLTGPVQLNYRELADARWQPGEDPTKVYLEHVLHQRLAQDLHYAQTRTTFGDLQLIGQTVGMLLGSGRK
jgi:lipopolysaccharide/colanic/teichoic acid biosynthesis glycosyltransferase